MAKYHHLYANDRTEQASCPFTGRACAENCMLSISVMHTGNKEYTRFCGLNKAAIELEKEGIEGWTYEYPEE